MWQLEEEKWSILHNEVGYSLSKDVAQRAVM
jgi:hypothetical protein